MSASAKNEQTALQWLQYIILRTFVRTLGILPRRAAIAVGTSLGLICYRVSGKLRAVGAANLGIAFPEMPVSDRSRILRGTFVNLGRHLAEFCLMSRYSAAFARGELMRYEGLENFLAADRAGKGVLVLTGHLGAWELSSFVHSLLGHAMGMVIRRLDNSRVDEMVNGIRCLHGNRVLHKDDFARGLLHAMGRGETVGILMDTNMTPPQGVFVPFFGVDACTASGLARVARKTGAAVLPGFLLWEESEKRYVLHFGEVLRLQVTPDAEADAVANTALFAKVTEGYIRRYPDQWLWLHRRWKTRPQGQPAVYDRSAADSARKPTQSAAAA